MTKARAGFSRLTGAASASAGRWEAGPACTSPPPHSASSSGAAPDALTQPRGSGRRRGSAGEDKRPQILSFLTQEQGPTVRGVLKLAGVIRFSFYYFYEQRGIYARKLSLPHPSMSHLRVRLMLLREKSTLKSYRGKPKTHRCYTQRRNPRPGVFTLLSSEPLALELILGPGDSAEGGAKGDD